MTQAIGIVTVILDSIHTPASSFPINHHAVYNVILTSVRIFGICRDIGLGFPQYGPIGAENWYNPGFFHNGWKGFFSVMIIAAFAHSGVEITGLSAASMQNPQKDLPKAVRNVFWRIVIVISHPLIFDYFKLT